MSWLNLRDLFTVVALLSLSGCASEIDLPGTTGSNSVLEGSALHFSETLYPIIQAQCSSCHESIQAPFFAFAKDAEKSHDFTLEAHLVNFQDPAESDLVVKVQSGHNCWTNCSADADQIQAAIERWKELRGTNTTGSEIRTAKVTIPTNVGTGATATLSFPLAGLASGIPSGAVMEIQVRSFTGDTYQFLNPQIKTSQPLSVKNISIILNEINADPTSAYSLIQTPVPALGSPPGSTAYSLSNSAVLIGKSLGLGSSGGPGIDQVQIQFEELGDASSVKVQRFASALSVIRTQCASCHTIERRYTFNAEARVVPPFANFTSESQFLGYFIGTLSSSPRSFVKSGDATNSAFYRSIADGVGGNNFPDVMDTMPENVNATLRAPMAATIQAWIDGMDD